MNDIKRNTFWFWGFLILLILNISAISSMFYVGYRMHHRQDYQAFHHRVFHHSGNANFNGHTKSWAKMNFNPAQKSFMLSTLKNHRQLIRENRKRLMLKQSQLFDALATKPVDTVKVNHLKADVLKIHRDIMEENITYYELLKTKLNAGQMELVKAHIQRQYNVRRFKSTKRYSKDNPRN